MSAQTLHSSTSDIRDQASNVRYHPCWICGLRNWDNKNIPRKWKVSKRDKNWITCRSLEASNVQLFLRKVEYRICNFQITVFFPLPFAQKKPLGSRTSQFRLFSHPSNLPFRQGRDARRRLAASPTWFRTTRNSKKKCVCVCVWPIAPPPVSPPAKTNCTSQAIKFLQYWWIIRPNQDWHGTAMAFRYLGYQEKQNVSFRRKQAQRTSLRSVRGRAATKTGTIERGGLRELRFRLDSAHPKLVTICAKLVTILNEPLF